ncbi:MAG TPA: sulfotransferase [Pyrinomonadaceae bacterium]|nr:sulfotransferase [Pyrinomonadaceae bacterium]
MVEENKLHATPPVFVLSCERSGSTLLRYIIDTHPQVCSPAHLHLGQLCRSLYISIFYSIGQTMEVTDEAMRERLVAGETRRVIDELMARYVSAKGKQMWCEKTTENLQYLKLLHDVFPDARYVCLYRNCMDVVHSSIECSRLGFIPELAPYVQKRPDNIVAAMVESWVEKTTTLLEFELAHTSQCFRIKYENLVAEPSQTLAPMFASFGLDWDESLLNAVFSTQHDQGSGDQKILFTKRVNTDSIGRGSTISRSNIPADLLKKMNHLLARLEYPPAGDDWDNAPSPYLPANVTGEQVQRVSSVEEMFREYVPKMLQNGNAAIQGVNGRCKFDVGDGGGTWMLTLRESQGVAEAVDGDADCTVRISAADLLDLVNGKLNTIAAFDRGKIHVMGDYELANKVGRLLFGG